MIRTLAIAALLAVLLPLPAGADPRARTAPSPDDLAAFKVAKITLAEAANDAAANGATIVEVEFDWNGGGGEYHAIAVKDGVVNLLLVNSGTGAVSVIEHAADKQSNVDPNVPKLMAAAKLPIQQAIATAQAANAGSAPIDAALAGTEAAPVYQIHLVENGTVKLVTVGAGDGRIADSR